MLKFPWSQLYSIGVRSYAFAIQILAPFNTKANEWIKGRKNWREELQKSYQKNKPVVWMHCASLGEFEQGKPVLDLLKQKHQVQLVVTFFSPSGFKKKNLAPADFIYYLPLDTRRNASDFLNLIQPDIAIFVKYEFWNHHLNTLKNLSIPCYLISAHFKPNHFLLKNRGKGFLPLLKSFEHIFLQTAKNQPRLKELGITSTTVTGDTRIDRVLETKVQPKTFPKIKAWIGEKPLFVAGSIWKDDDETIMNWVNNQKEFKVILAPHELGKNRLTDLKNATKNLSALYTDEIWQDGNVLILNTIGMLSDIYAQADLAYVGGGFKTGLHNILEPAVFGIPVIFGPLTKGRPEAEDLIGGGLAQSVSNANEFSQSIEYFANGSHRKKAQKFAEAYFAKHRGAALKIYNHLAANFDQPEPDRDP